MPTALFTHLDCLLHDNGPGHPESPRRLQVILDELKQPAYAGLIPYQAPEATKDQLGRVHDQAYIKRIFEKIPLLGSTPLDSETILNPFSGKAALRAAGSLIAAVDYVMAGEERRAFCAVRPPGHHANVPPASGFCLFNNIAIGAAHALASYKLSRIAVIDFDVHHGNGTEAWAKEQEAILFCSSHQSPLWPGSGKASDTGPKGNIINLPLAPGTPGQVFWKLMQERLFPALDRFQPELIMISAGFDAHRDDPLGGLGWTEDDFTWITDELVRSAKRHCQGRIVSTLEGGYDLKALALSAGAHVKALLTA